jgi:hypothetical protein
LDDGLLITRGNPNEIIKEFNELDPNIELTWTISTTSIDFLDLVIFKGERFYLSGILDTNIHQKQLNKYLYVPFNSFHTIRTKKAIITGELIRYIRSCSSQITYIDIKRKFYSRLRARGYPPKFLLECFNNIRYSDRPKFIFGSTHKTGEKQNPLVLTTEFNPLTDRINLKSIITHNWNIIHNDKTLQQLFRRPIIGYRNSRSLRNSIISAHVRPPTTPIVGTTNPNNPD